MTVGTTMLGTASKPPRTESRFCALVLAAAPVQGPLVADKRRSTYR
jgi:hypothetical protein